MIEGHELVYRYPSEPEPVLCGVSVVIEPGEVIGIVGPNGSGKSTLSRLLKGLLLPESGSVCVDGTDSRADGLEVRRRVGLVFQNPNSQIVNAVVEQEVAFGPENLGLASGDIRNRVDAGLCAVGLGGRELAECHSLSMADKQRVAIAAVLAMEPRYLILDEPTAWLEPRARWTLLRAVADWAQACHAGLVLVTHRMDEAQICSRLYGMLDGRVEVTGTPSEILRNADVRERLSLVVPDSFVLAAHLRTAGLPIEEGAPLEAMAEAFCRS